MTAMDAVVILSRQAQQYLLHAITANLAVSDACGLFLWSQGELQALLPHRLLICLQLDTAGEILRRVAAQWLPGVGRSGCDLPSNLRTAAGIDGTLAREGGRPIVVQPGENSGLAGLGIDNLLAHGSMSMPGGSTFFVLCDLPQSPGARQAHFLRLLLPHLHLTLMRLPCANVSLQRPLSQREIEVLRWLREGKGNEEIGSILGISGCTVKNHLQRLYRVLGVSNRAQAVKPGTIREIEQVIFFADSTVVA